MDGSHFASWQPRIRSFVPFSVNFKIEFWREWNIFRACRKGPFVSSTFLFNFWPHAPPAHFESHFVKYPKIGCSKPLLSSLVYTKVRAKVKVHLGICKDRSEKVNLDFFLSVWGCVRSSCTQDYPYAMLKTLFLIWRKNGYVFKVWLDILKIKQIGRS